MTKIQEFNALHATQDILLLGNTWDLLSALTLERVGFKAIGTTSWGIANSLGFPDGEYIDFARHLAIIKTIVENVNIPVSADIEAGYGTDTQTILDNVLRTAEVGVAGINIEDSLKQQNGLRAINEHCALLVQMRTMLDNNGYQDFFINARTDTYFQLDQPFSETMTRAQAYVDSGASGVFIPGLAKHEEIRAITSAIEKPINVMSVPGLTNCQTLQQLGVKRFSFGNALSDKIISYLTKDATRIIEAKDTAFLYE
ncbi:isocitrate lyase/phosphoenolpyruvate mutase family protein [Lysinibacillus sp. NPDC097195]|uniref:isocitrate lyase/PEP mutase family protein n=1 Tax=Lysinibacillus sp. NPDC097195 TaxID=3364141 RepID=UPI0038295860